MFISMNLRVRVVYLFLVNSFMDYKSFHKAKLITHSHEILYMPEL